MNYKDWQKQWQVEQNAERALFLLRMGFDTKGRPFRPQSLPLKVPSIPISIPPIPPQNKKPPPQFTRVGDIAFTIMPRPAAGKRADFTQAKTIILPKLVEDQ